MKSGEVSLWTVKADGRVLTRCYTEKAARKFANNYFLGCVCQEDSFRPDMEVIEETLSGESDVEE